MVGRWLDDVTKALRDLGGEGHLSQIYPRVLEYRRELGAPIGEHKEWVRNCLQSNSRGKGHNVFRPGRLSAIRPLAGSIKATGREQAPLTPSSSPPIPARIITALRALENKKDTNPRKKHGNIPL